MNRNANGMSTGMAILCTLGILLFIGWMIDLGTPKCIKSGCDNDAKDGSSYCYLHDNSTYRYKGSTSYSGNSKSSGSSSTTKSSNTSSGEKSNGTTSNSKKTYSSGSSSSKKNQSSMDSYDDGYNAIYEDDDYDWDRYLDLCQYLGHKKLNAFLPNYIRENVFQADKASSSTC